MTVAHLYPADAEARAHVLEPFDSGMDGPDAACSDDPHAHPLWREAYERGLAEGKQQTEQTLLTVAEALAEGIRGLREEQSRGRDAMREGVLRLSLAIARQVVMSELKTNPAAVGELVLRLLEEADGRKVSAVRLHPGDAALLAGTPAAEALEEAKIVVHASEEVGPGGCVLETNFGRLDGRLETRLAELARTLMGAKDANDSHGTPEDGMSKGNEVSQ